MWIELVGRLLFCRSTMDIWMMITFLLLGNTIPATAEPVMIEFN
jgi:hypothetical protein